MFIPLFLTDKGRAFLEAEALHDQRSKTSRRDRFLYELETVESGNEYGIDIESLSSLIKSLGISRSLLSKDLDFLLKEGYLEILHLYLRKKSVLGFINMPPESFEENFDKITAGPEVYAYAEQSSYSTSFAQYLVVKDLGFFPEDIGTSLVRKSTLVSDLEAHGIDSTKALEDLRKGAILLSYKNFEPLQVSSEDLELSTVPDIQPLESLRYSMNSSKVFKSVDITEGLEAHDFGFIKVMGPSNTDKIHDAAIDLRDYLRSKGSKCIYDQGSNLEHVRVLEYGDFRVFFISTRVDHKTEVKILDEGQSEDSLETLRLELRLAAGLTPGRRSQSRDDLVVTVYPDEESKSLDIIRQSFEGSREDISKS